MTNAHTMDGGRRPLRILQAVAAMDRGGIETWLLHVMRHARRCGLHMDFLVSANRRCVYDEEIEALGGRLIRCVSPRRWDFARDLKRIVERYGPYDALDSHYQFKSGVVLRAARQAGIPVRIAHSHLDTRLLKECSGFWYRLYARAMQSWIRKYATHGVAVSDVAGMALFGRHWQVDPRWQKIYPGIDLSPFEQHVDRAAVRAEFSLPLNAEVIGHVGRFSPQKNHLFLCAIARELLALRPQARFLLVGDGPERPAIEAEVARAGIAHRVIIAVGYPDVPRLLLGAMDAFVLPSLSEGLPLVLLEAQAAGLPCLVARHVSAETDVVPGLVTRLSLADSPRAWAEALAGTLTARRDCPRESAQACLAQSPFNIEKSAQALADFYRAACEGRPEKAARRREGACRAPAASCV